MKNSGKNKNVDFSLIETMLWEDGSYLLLGLHLQRMSKSADVFSFSYDQDKITELLTQTAASFELSKKYRVRMLLDRSGKTDITSDTLEDIDTIPVRIVLSGERVDKTDIFLCHKTTNRALYDTELERCRALGFFDVIFTNTEDQITEGAITNIIIHKNGEYYTPPVSCGLLPGIFRQHILETAILLVKEKILYLEDIVKADKIYLMNSVRKMVPAVFAGR